MKKEKIIKENGLPRFGRFTGDVDFNYIDSDIRNFFGKKTTGYKKKNLYHQFFFLGIYHKKYTFGTGLVDLSYIRNLFFFLYDGEKRSFHEWNKNVLTSSRWRLDRNPENFTFSYNDRNSRFYIEKNKTGNILRTDFHMPGLPLDLKMESCLSDQNNNPLKVCNPSGPDRWFFTEKCAGFSPKEFSVNYMSKNMSFKSEETFISYDWSGGYPNRRTNWYWAAFSGLSEEGDLIGLNAAALINETFFNENAFWINGQAILLSQVMFDFDPRDPEKQWRIINKNAGMEIIFSPGKVRGKKMNTPLIKTNFTQICGLFSGKIKQNDRYISFRNVSGFTEIQKAVW